MEHCHGGQHTAAKMQSSRKQATNTIIPSIALLMILWLGAGEAATSKSSPLANWRFSDPHYTSNQYAKILGESGVGHDPDDKDQLNAGLNLNPEHLQIQYVDYQPQCQAGGVPVCATNGTDTFYFENDCRLEAHNIKMLFQYGTELEPTEMERCLPSCQTMKCTPMERPVCALAEIGGAVPQTFANECEMRRRECHTKQVLRLLHQGPCPAPTKSLRKKKQPRRNKKKPLKASSKPGSQPKKVYYLMATTAPTAASAPGTTTAPPSTSPRRANNNRRWLSLSPGITATTPRTMATSSTSTSPAPMQFQQLVALANPMVSVSRAVDAYNVYNIPDVGQDYGEITDSSLSLYLPGVGRVTEAYASSSTARATTQGTSRAPTTATSTTTTTTTTPEPLLTSTKRQPITTTMTRASTWEPLLSSTQALGEEQSTAQADLGAVTPGSSTTTQESTTKDKSP